MNTFVWLVRREFWENRAIWILPAVIAGLMVIASAVGHVEISAAEAGSPGAAALFFYATGMVFFSAMYLYVFWYLLDCLHADRKDRSILFWKSMPISDTATVLSKAAVAMVALPAVYFVASDLALLLMAAILSVRSQVPLGGLLWQPALWLSQQAVWIYLCVTSAIWYLPIVGWLMLVSAWAKRAVILYSVLLPLGILLAERLLFGTHEAALILMSRISGYKDVALKYPPSFHWSFGRGESVSSVLTLLDPQGFARSPAVWIGVAVGAAFIVGAIELRKRRADA
jgi:ABC-2 type transport system permease protein